MIEIFFDGSCQPTNPRGRGGFGWIAYKDGKELAMNGGFCGEGEMMSNNVAEYCAVLDAMRWASITQSGENILFKGDSQLVIFQLNGAWKIKRGLYTSWARQAKQFANDKPFRFEWVPREQNAKADRLAQGGAQSKEIWQIMGGIR